jgi:amicyanin
MLRESSLLAYGLNRHAPHVSSRVGRTRSWTSRPRPRRNAHARIESPTQGLKFLPPEIHIEAGTTVLWVNQDVVAHNVTHKVKLEDQLFDSPYLETGESFSFTFDEPGTYPVYCLPHPFMTQTVLVSKKP